jgi:hypothetical protein
MVEYLLLPVALFWILKFLGMWVEAPGWLWQLLILGGSTLALVPWDQPWLQWFSPFVIAGLVVLLQAAENLMIAKGDEAITAVMRATARRPR